MSQPTIANNLLQALEVVNSPYKQAHRSIDCCNLYCEYPLPTPQGLLPHFQFRTLDTISAVEVYDVTDTLVDTWDTSIFTIDAISGINYYSYMGTTVPDLDCGKYYLKLIGAAGNYFTQLFIVSSICCLPQLLWWNNCNTQTTVYENGYTNQVWLRALGDARFESVAVSETTEQDGKIFKEYGALEDYFSVEVGPVYNYFVRAMQSITLHENIVYIDRNGEYAKLLGMSVEEVNSVGGRCLYKIKLKMRQANAFSSNYCCDEIADATEQGLPTPEDTGCGNIAPCFPIEITNITIAAASATISWAAVPGADDYEISVDGGAFSSVGNVTTYVVASLTSCTDYTVCIRADCGENNSTSNCISFTTAAIPCGSCPEENFFITSYTATAISIAFDGSAAATGYEIQWKPISDLWGVASTDLIVGVAGTNNYDIEDLLPCTTYQIRFRPLCVGNECNPVGCWSMISATTECCDSLIDYDIDITEGNCLNPDSDITITVTDYDTTYTITIYEGGTPVVASTDSSLVTSLPPGSYTVIVEDRLCSTTPFAFVINDPCPCLAPTVLASFPGEFSATLDWDDILGSSGYELQWRAVTSVTWIDVTGLAASAYILSGLENCTVYEWRVRSVCEGTPSSWSAINVFQTTGCDCENNLGIAVSCEPLVELWATTIDETYTLVSMTIGGTTYTPPSPILLSNYSALETYFNGLSTPYRFFFSDGGGLSSSTLITVLGEQCVQYEAGDIFATYNDGMIDSDTDLGYFLTKPCSFYAISLGDYICGDCCTCATATLTGTAPDIDTDVIEYSLDGGSTWNPYTPGDCVNPTLGTDSQVIFRRTVTFTSSCETVVITETVTGCTECVIEITGVEISGLVPCDAFWYYETNDTLPDTADFISITIGGNTYTPPAPIAASDTTALQAYLNSLTILAKFRVVDSGVGYININMFTGCGDPIVASFDYNDGGGDITIDFTEPEVQLTCEDVQFIIPDFDCNVGCNEAGTVDITVSFNATCVSGANVLVTLSGGLGSVSVPATDGVAVFNDVPANGETVTVTVADGDCNDTFEVVLPDCGLEYEIADNGSSVGCDGDTAGLQIDVVNSGLIDIPMGTVFDLSWSGLPGGATFITLTGGTPAIDGTTFTLDSYDIGVGINFNFAVEWANAGCATPINIELTITSADITVPPLIIILTYP